MIKISWCWKSEIRTPKREGRSTNGNSAVPSAVAAAGLSVCALTADFAQVRREGRDNLKVREHAIAAIVDKETDLPMAF